MAKNSSRSGRLSDLLHREIAMLIRDQIKDPRLGMVTISGVVVTEDLSFARVYVTVLEDERRIGSSDDAKSCCWFFSYPIVQTFNFTHRT